MNDMTRRKSRRRRMACSVGTLLVACTGAACASGSGAVSPTTATAYVATGANVANPGNQVAVVDLATPRPLTPITVGTLPAAMAVTPDNRDVLVAVKAEDRLVEIDVDSGDVVGSTSVGLEPDAVAVTPDGSLALVANLQDATVTPVRLPSLRAGLPISVGRQPTSIAVSPDGRLALVTNFQDGTVTPIVLPSLAPGAPIAAGQEPVSVYIAGPAQGAPPGGLALVADFQTNTLTPITLPIRVPGAPIALAANPTGIAGWPNSSTVYVSGGASVTPVQVATRTAGPAIPVGSPAEALALADHGRAAWVCTADGDLVHLDLTTGRVAGTTRIGGQPSAIAIAQPTATPTS